MKIALDGLAGGAKCFLCGGVVDLDWREGVKMDAGNFKGASEVENLRKLSRREVEKYVNYMSKRGLFAGQLVFKDENPVRRWLHNYTFFELQRRLYHTGRAMLILPIQV